MAGNRDRDDNSLAHTAGKLVRILVVTALSIRDSNLTEHIECLRLCLRSLDSLIELDTLLNLATDLL